jgi:hypothetical protein
MNISVNGQLVPPISDGVLIAAQIHGEHRVGELLRQPTVRNDDGLEQRLDEYLGGGFCLVGSQRKDLELGTEATAVWRRLAGHSIALENFEISEGHWDPLFDRYRAAVIRPDRYIFGVVDADHDTNRLIIELGRQLSLSTERSHARGERS